MPAPQRHAASMVKHDQSPKLIALFFGALQEELDLAGCFVPAALVDPDLKPIGARAAKNVLASHGRGERDGLLDDRRALTPPTRVIEDRREIQQQLRAQRGVISEDGERLLQANSRAIKISAVREAERLPGQKPRGQEIILTPGDPSAP